MQIFLPYPSFKESLKVLDNKRLGKQLVETYQIISAITRRPKLDGTPYKGWLNHPCTIMWKNNVTALKLYLNYSIEEWVVRGFKNTMNYEIFDEDPVVPSWFGNEKFHSSHRANLLKKEPNFYAKYNWTEDPSNPYVWIDKDGRWYEQHSGKNGKIYIS
jgi:hypothetical protein